MSRAESGVVQFGDDWPGLFLRGKDCHLFASHLEEALTQAGDTIDPITLAVVSGLVGNLRSSDQKYNEGGQLVTHFKEFDECKK